MLTTGSDSTRRSGLVMKIHLRAWGMLLAFAWAAMMAGCGPRTEVVLVDMPGAHWPMTLHLRSERAAFAPGPDGVDRVLLAWPLPGSEHGQSVYELYLCVPADEGTFPVGRVFNGQHPVAGMFIQCTGRRAGRTDVMNGTIRLNGRGGEGPTHRRGELVVECRDGTQIAGRFDARLSMTTVTQFEDHHQTDIRETIAAAAAGTSSEAASSGGARGRSGSAPARGGAEALRRDHRSEPDAHDSHKLAGAPRTGT